jgi:hypothetical protein
MGRSILGPAEVAQLVGAGQQRAVGDEHRIAGLSAPARMTSPVPFTTGSTFSSVMRSAIMRERVE